jgi:lipid-A-disaccharide synthase
MKPKSFMVIAGEASGDMLAAELVRALRQEYAEAKAVPTTDYQPLHTGLEPRFFGAGGPQMAAAGVELAFDLTAHSAVGLSDVLRKQLKFRQLFRQLFQLALERQPDVIICVDFSEFNLRFAHAIRQYTRAHADWFHDWNPKIVRYPSPQVWASREGRAYQMANDLDLVLSIFPFEKAWYAQRVPQLPVEFVGHPIVDRYGERHGVKGEKQSPPANQTLLLLPGSRAGEIARHLPVMVAALELIRAKVPDVRAQMVLPNEKLIKQAKGLGFPAWLGVQVGGLPEALSEAEVAIASTGTVTMECAYFRVPTVALYKTSWITYQIGRRIVKVKYLAMPNLLANEEVFPEFIQGAATPDSITSAAVGLLRDKPRRDKIRAKLAEIVASLGGPGASRRAAKAIVKRLKA